MIKHYFVVKAKSSGEVWEPYKTENKKTAEEFKHLYEIHNRESAWIEERDEEVPDPMPIETYMAVDGEILSRLLEERKIDRMQKICLGSPEILARTGEDFRARMNELKQKIISGEELPIINRIKPEHHEIVKKMQQDRQLYEVMVMGEWPEKTPEKNTPPEPEMPPEPQWPIKMKKRNIDRINGQLSLF